MSPKIQINDVFKNKFDYFKQKSGSKTYSDAINLCLIQIKLLEDNQRLMFEVRDALKTMNPISQSDIKTIDALRRYVNTENDSDKLAMFVRLMDSKANLHKLLVSQGQIRDAQNVYAEWKALVEVANLLGIESELELIKKEE